MIMMTVITTAVTHSHHHHHHDHSQCADSSCSSQASRGGSSWGMTRVALYLPSLLGDLRTLLAFLGLCVSTSFPVRGVTLWIASTLLSARPDQGTGDQPAGWSRDRDLELCWTLQQVTSFEGACGQLQHRPPRAPHSQLMSWQNPSCASSG
jgi:hypothetical protein